MPLKQDTMRRVRCLYLDLDGTLLGQGGSLLHDGEGGFTLLGVRAMEACLRAGARGRRCRAAAGGARRGRAAVRAAPFIFEAGACLVLDGEEHWLTEPGGAHEQIAAPGRPALLLERYAGRLEYHPLAPRPRGLPPLPRTVDAVEADALLAEHGHDDLRLVDNGAATAARPRWPTRMCAPTTWCPRALRRRARRGAPAGPRPARARTAWRWATRARTSGWRLAVGAFWLVANAIERDPDLREASRGLDGRVAEAGYGPGVYEAVVTTLAERR